MSRSYRKTPYGGLNKCKFSKNYSNRVIRRRPVTEEISDGASYKNYYDRYSICDCTGYPEMTFNNFKLSFDEYRYFRGYLERKVGRELTDKDIWYAWYRIYVRK